MRVHWLAWLLIVSVGLGISWFVAALVYFFDEFPRSWDDSKVEAALEVLRYCFLGLAQFTLAAGAVWVTAVVVRCIRRG